MPVLIYNSGELYAGSLTYGRISGGLLAAQEARTRETALKVSVIDERVNQWSYVIGAEIFRDSFYLPVAAGNELVSTHQSYWFRRGQGAMVKLSNGNIYRVRIGTDSSTTDRQVYDQTITAPLTSSQWTTWAVKYTGDHYAVALYADGVTPLIYHSKVDGVYRNNVLQTATTDVVYLASVIDQKDAVFMTKVRADVASGADLDILYTPDITTTAPVADPTNFRWYRNFIQAAKLASGKVARVHMFGAYQKPRTTTGRADSITYSEMPAYTDNTPTPIQLIRGLGGTTGANNISAPIHLAKLEDGYYYIFHREIPTDPTGDGVSNLNTVWQRSKDLRHWSAPIASGFQLVWPSGVVRHSGYYWIAGNGAVHRRPDSSSITDISNYVPKVQFEMARENQPGSGTCVVANPAGINDSILALSDREVKIEIGLRIPTGTFEYVQFNKWFLTRPSRVVSNVENRLNLNFADIWARLDNPLRDTYNWIGQTQWTDWSVDKRNKSFNYYFVTDTSAVTIIEATANVLTTKGICLWTGWKGTNADFQAYFSGVSGNPQLIFRYQDSTNYLYVEKSGSTLNLKEKVAGVDTTLATAATVADTSITLRVKFTWGVIQAWVNGTLVITHTVTNPVIQGPGYVGFNATAYKISSFTFIEWQAELTSENLIRSALALGDFHDIIASSSDTKQLAITWGPQTDLSSPAAALKDLLEQAKLELIWRNGFVEVGKFTDPSIIKVVRDQVLSSEETDEANRRINLATVDGNEHTRIEVDITDTQSRGRQIVAYYDLPELTTQADVNARALEEIRRSKLGQSPGGEVVLFLDLWRMDAITWIDNAGLSKNVRIEGMSVDIDQGKEPYQRQVLDTSILET